MLNLEIWAWAEGQLGNIAKRVQQFNLPGERRKSEGKKKGGKKKRKKWRREGKEKRRGWRRRLKEREKKTNKVKMNTLSMYVEKIFIYSRIAKAGKEL